MHACARVCVCVGVCVCPAKSMSHPHVVPGGGGGGDVNMTGRILECSQIYFVKRHCNNIIAKSMSYLKYIYSMSFHH